MMASLSKDALTGTETVLARIRTKLKHLRLEHESDLWLDTGSSILNAVFGSAKRGLPFGRVYHLYGPESSGKTALALELAGIAQRKGAAIIWYDAEMCFDAGWARKRGLDPDKVFLLKPYVGKFGDEDEERLISAEELFSEAKQLCRLIHKRRTDQPIFFGVDSITALLPREEGATEVEDNNMRTKQAIPAMMSPLLRQWAGLCLSCNVMLFMINQLRDKPGAMFGPKEGTPGGRAIKYYSSAMVAMRRDSGRGKIISGGRQIGLKGTLRNDKNKVGSGSIELLEARFAIYFDGKKRASFQIAKGKGE